MGSDDRASFVSMMSVHSASVSSDSSAASVALASSLSEIQTVATFDIVVDSATASESATSTDVFATTGVSAVSTAPSSTSTSESTVAPQTPLRMELSTGAKVGIGVGISIAAVLLIGALVLYLKSRTNRAQASPKWFWQKTTMERKAKLSWACIKTSHGASGTPPNRQTSQEALRIAELSSISCTHELDGRSHMTPELDGEGRRR
jgi:hypothetical protein